MEMNAAALGAAVLLAGVFALGGERRRLLAGFWHHRRRVSAAAGVSVAYVFVDVLPELAAQNAALNASVANARFYAEQRIYCLALLSFVFMYGLEHLVLSQRARGDAEARGSADAVYWLHLAGFAAYSALIGYLLVERAERGHAALAVYVAAMAIHFVVVNHSLTEEHGEVYRRQGHWVLAASVLVGWALASAIELSDLAFARLFALLAGGVVITSLRAELPDDRDGRFWPFCIAAVVFAAVLLVA